MSGRRNSIRYTIRPSGKQGKSWDHFEPALLDAWEVAKATGEKVTLLHGRNYIGYIEADGRLRDSEMRQIAVCVTPTQVVMT